MSNNIKKYTFLGILIVFPIFIFLFLKTFGKNYYTLPIYYPIDSTQVEGKWEKRYHQIPEFSFTNQKGELFTQKALKGKVYVAEFFFTRCASICPVMTTQLARIQERFRDNPQVQLLSFTIDPENDNVEVLKAYAAKYRADESDNWQFLTGEKAKIYDLAKQGFKVTALDVGTEITPDLSHTSRVTLVDQQGRIRGYYDATDEEVIDQLMAEISILLQE